MKKEKPRQFSPFGEFGLSSVAPPVLIPYDHFLSADVKRCCSHHLKKKPKQQQQQQQLQQQLSRNQSESHVRRKKTKRLKWSSEGATFESLPWTVSLGTEWIISCMLYRKKPKKVMFDAVDCFLFVCLFFLSTFCRPKVTGCQQRRVSTPFVPGGRVALDPTLPERLLPLHHGAERGSHSVPAMLGGGGSSQRSGRRRSKVSVLCICLASRSLGLTRRTRIRSGGLGSAAAGAAVAAP